MQLSLSSEPLSAPVVTEWIEQQIAAPVVGVEPLIEDRLAARGWRVSVMWEGKEIGVVRNSTPLAERHIDLGIALAGLSRLDSLGVIVAELVVESTTGAAVVARDTLAIAFEARGNAQSANEADRYLGEFFAPVSQRSEVAPLVRHIVATMPARATIVVHAPQAHAALSADLDSTLRAEAGRQGKTIESILHVPPTRQLPESLFAVSVAGSLRQH